MRLLNNDIHGAWTSALFTTHSDTNWTDMEREMIVLSTIVPDSSHYTDRIVALITIWNLE